MSRNPYFSHLPTWRNRQDLAYALDSLPHILDSLTSSQSTCSSAHSSRIYPSPPSSPCSSISHSWTSTSSSTSHASLSSCTQRQRYQQRLIERHLYSRLQRPAHFEGILQFSTRAQAMGLLIDILRSLQEEPCKCDLVQGCFCSPDGVEDHSGMAPCYVCGEWYAEQVYCRDEETMEVYQVDGRRWHERQGASLRHHVAEARVRKWLDQVVVPALEPQHAIQEYEQQHHAPSRPTLQRSNTLFTESTTAQRPIPTRSGTMPASYLIPQEILDPSRRMPGFRIRSKADLPASAVPSSSSSSPIRSNDETGLAAQRRAEDAVAENSSSSCASPSSTGCTSSTGSLRFSFTSERFKVAIQQQTMENSSYETQQPHAQRSAAVASDSSHRMIEEDCAEHKIQLDSSLSQPSSLLSSSSSSPSSSFSQTIPLSAASQEHKKSQSTDPATVAAIPVETSDDLQNSAGTSIEQQRQDSHSTSTSDAVQKSEDATKLGALESSQVSPRDGSAQFDAVHLVITYNLVSDDVTRVSVTHLTEVWPLLTAGWQSIQKVIATRCLNAASAPREWLHCTSRLAL